jgi:hypothetical protein
MNTHTHTCEQHGLSLAGGGHGARWGVLFGARLRECVLCCGQ